FVFVDLPGYGYARVPPAVKKTWGPMIETYLKGRENLRGAVLLMDVRRKPQQEEKMFIDWLRYYRIPAVLVLTKADKLSKSKQALQRIDVAKALGVDAGRLILFSIKTRQGRMAVWEAIEGLL
ncbi:MAG: YihA family ribosome biogenesis GTP-binding protein, partial [Candidatus Babeliaceae bacterium]|nr:YihA family ribosome biogenesis GTP-binding protein [Candidatus Babeliaceae bacterium]